MKYSIEVNSNTVTEQLEYNGREYQKTWHADANRICTKSARALKATGYPIAKVAM